MSFKLRLNNRNCVSAGFACELPASIILTLLKARFELPQDADPEAVKVLDERFNEHLTFKLCEDLALSLCNLFGNKEDDNTLSSTIEKYIKDNYKDPS